MNRPLIFLTLIIILLAGILTHAQQIPTNLVETEVITTRNIADLQHITTLGEGRLIALDWHPAGEALALARGVSVCLLDSQLEITQCVYDTGEVRDLSWDATGTRLALINDTGLQIRSYDTASNEFTSTQFIEASGNCVVWTTEGELLTVFFQFYGRHVSLRAVYTLTENGFVRDEESDSTDYSTLLQAQCQADKDTGNTTLTITDWYFVGRTYHAIQIGDEEQNRRVTERLGSLRDVAWQIPDETFTYIVDDGLVHYSLVPDTDGNSTGEIIRTQGQGTARINTLYWSPDGTQLLSGGATFDIWSNESRFMSGDISRHEIQFPNVPREVRIRWIDNTHISYEGSDWYQGYFWSAAIFDSITGERDYTISFSMLYPYSDDDFPVFEWNPSYNAYMIFTEEGFKITRLLEEQERIGYNTEVGDFGIDVATQDYVFIDIPCDSYSWIDDRYFSCSGQNKETIIDSFTGETGIEPLTIEEEKTSFYDIEAIYEPPVISIIDTTTGNTTIKLSLPNLHPQTFSVRSFPDSGLMTWYKDEGIHFWDVPSGEELLFLDDPSITGMNLHPDGHILAVGTSTGLVHLYGVPQSSE